MHLVRMRVRPASDSTKGTIRAAEGGRDERYSAVVASRRARAAAALWWSRPMNR
jgi:hypothetical protein